MTDLMGRSLGGRYLLQEQLAAGGMGTLWRARDETLGRAVAVKVLHSELAKDPEILERFRLEAVAAARLSHPAVVRVFDTGVDDETCYIVMELLEGPTLAGMLEDGPLAPDDAIGVCRSVLDALAHAHAAGIVHRDVKPSNVLTDGAGLVKVADFGIAKAAFAKDLTTTGKLLGTARYLAPEQVSGGGLDGRADIYSLGTVLYEMLTGRVPFEAETDLAAATLRLTDEPTPPRALRAGIPRPLERVVLRALAREPAERFQTAEEMRAELDRLGRPAPAPGPPPTHAPRRGRTSVLRSWALVPSILLLVAALAVGAWFWLDLEVGGPFGVRLGEGDATSSDGLGFTAFAAARDHDPQGDGGEHPEEAVLAHDGDPATFWETERYNSSDLGGAKEGVGLVLDAGGSRRLSAVRLRSTLPGWRFELRPSEDGTTFPRALPDVGGTTTFEAGLATTVRFQPIETRYLMVWITGLAETGDGYRATIAEALYERA